jgi:subtilisin family serine protease
LDAPEVHDFGRTLEQYGAESEPLFSRSAAFHEIARGPSYDPTRDKAAYFAVTAPEEALSELRSSLSHLHGVAGVYLLPPTSPAGYYVPSDDFTTMQGYLEPAPQGLDAEHAWGYEGGRGDGVRVADIEGACCFEHETYAGNRPQLGFGTPSDDRMARAHGSAVLAIVGAPHDGVGVSGIAPNAELRLVAHEDVTARAIEAADEACDVGDILLVEAQRWGPLHVEGEGEVGAVAIEWYPADFLAIRAATQRGRIVVAAAGNGNQYLLHPAYDAPPDGAAAPWSSNPFRRDPGGDSGSILVGAGAPAAILSSQAHGASRSRLPFSNWGPCVDVQGWGEDVVTAGYGDLDHEDEEDRAYTASFRGTSAAAAMVAGAVACLQGAVKARGADPLTPSEVRDWLRAAASGQQDEPGRPALERIGGLPDLRALLEGVFD